MKNIKIKLLLLALVIGITPVKFFPYPSELNAVPSEKYSSNNSLKVKYAWLTNLPDNKKYFNRHERKTIELIGMDNYLKITEDFGQRAIYFGNQESNKEQTELINLIGYKNYLKLAEHFNKKQIYFGSIRNIKKIWAIKNKNIDPSIAASILGVSSYSIYRWRNKKGSENYR